MYYLSYKEPGNYQANHQFDGFKVRENANMVDVVLACQNYVWSPIRWRFGVRKALKFQGASLCVFDFDEGVSLEEAKENIFADCQYAIATTKSHQKGKDGKPPCDRFRVCIPFEREITSLDDYKFTMKRLADRYGADPACVDGARFFWPFEGCEWWTNDEGLDMDVFKAPPKIETAPVTYPAGSLPFWASWFLEKGEPCRGSSGRNDMIMRISRWANQYGWGRDDLRARIMSGQFSREGFPDSEIDEIINKVWR